MFNFFSFHNPIRFILSILIIFCFYSCTSSPDRNNFSEMETKLETATAMNTGSQNSIPVEPVSIEEPAVIDTSENTFQKGVMLTSINPNFVQEVINQSTPYPIQHIILADPSIPAVDHLLYQPARMEQIQQTARTAQSQAVKTFLWSREINLEGSSFVFIEDTPLVVARQTAYRNVLQKVPELNGFVLSLEDAILPPWKASSVMQNGSINAAQRSLFVINMIKKVVVDEFGKQLIIYVPSNFPESMYIADALNAVDDERIQVITTSSEILSKSPINGVVKVHWLADALGGEHGLIAALPDEMVNGMSQINPNQHAGMTINIGNETKPLWDTVNGVNWHVFNSWTPGIALHETIWDEWVQQVLGTLPVSDEGRLLHSILQEGTHHSKRLVWFLTGNEDKQASESLPVAQRFFNQYSQINQQLLIDIAQESFEQNSWCSSAGQNTNKILQPVMRPKIYQDLVARLERMQQIISLQHYSQQCVLGFQVWKDTRNEMEALYLESHLLSLENELQRNSNQVITNDSIEQLSQMVAQIRSEFPQVLLGAVPRDWNKITGIRIQQVNTNEIVLFWQTDVPSRARVLLTDTTSLMNRVIDGDNREVIYHQMVINSLQPSQKYMVKIQCVTTDGNITNSGTIPLILNSLSL